MSAHSDSWLICDFCAIYIIIAAALDQRFRSLKFLDKIGGSCSKFDVRTAISSMLLQIEIGRADDNVNVNQAAAGASDGLRSSRERIRRDNEKKKAMNDLFDGDEDNCRHPEEVVANEITRYFGEKDVDRDVNILQWWAVNEHRFKLLARLARQYVVITATSTPCERLFSEAGAIADKKRAS